MTDDNIEKRLQETIRDNEGNLSKTSRQTGVSYTYLKSKYEDKIEAPAWPLEAEPKNIGVLGRKGMEKYVIAVKRRMSAYGWPVKYNEAIQDARNKYDAGTHVVCTGHLRGWAILYLIPRRTPVEPTNWFSSMGEFYD